jgi:hypothetical protein
MPLIEQAAEMFTRVLFGAVLTAEDGQVGG